MTWQTYFDRAFEAGYNNEIEVPKAEVDTLPDRFSISRLALHKGAARTYRDSSPVDTVHIREFDSHYTVEIDRYHPRHHPVRHAVLDAAKYTAASVGLLGMTALSSRFVSRPALLQGRQLLPSDIRDSVRGRVAPFDRLRRYRDS